MTRYDPAPVLAIARYKIHADTGEPPTEGQLAALIGCDRRTVTRMRAGQQIDTYRADRYAVRLGLHPLLLWPDFHAEVAA